LLLGVSARRLGEGGRGKKELDLSAGGRLQETSERLQYHRYWR
jgi:hypothetical protein